ncbi:MAG: rhamnogalacturonan acetylesterase [Bacteroidales bacterium]|nr:rhamnogalacturonan acetylesterase [Bacteroidales bacterium]MBN2698501.1 rhamnogalacturonan acetylesterase [Bacteroidales bacterium]
MRTALIFIALLSLIPACDADSPDAVYKFDFGNAETEKDFQQVSSDRLFTGDNLYGFLPGLNPESVTSDAESLIMNDLLMSEKPFVFVMEIPEGNYDVVVKLGNPGKNSKVTLKAESRRLMVHNCIVPAGGIRTITFTTNVRYPEINDSLSVRLKPREKGHFNWDQLLSVEFNGTYPSVFSMEVIRNYKAKTLYLAGNSTVTDQRFEPYSAWGQMLPFFFKPGIISVANHAESGEALKSFIGEHRLEKIWNTIREGDYLFIQFAHNDQKPESSAYLEARTGYKAYLKQYISGAREHGAVPVLITPMQRRNFDDSGKVINTHGDYPEAMREVAREEGVKLIDLEMMSRRLYEAMGSEDSKKLFVHYPAGSYPGQLNDLKDNSHHSTFGAFQLAKCVVEGIRQNLPELSELLRDDIASYNPSVPDPYDEWKFPFSPVVDLMSPEGR